MSERDDELDSAEAGAPTSAAPRSEQPRSEQPRSEQPRSDQPRSDAAPGEAEASRASSEHPHTVEEHRPDLVPAPGTNVFVADEDDRSESNWPAVVEVPLVAVGTEPSLDDAGGETDEASSAPDGADSAPGEDPANAGEGDEDNERPARTSSRPGPLARRRKRPEAADDEGSGAYPAETSDGHGNTVTQVGVVAILVIGVMLLHQYAVPRANADLDPTAMLALGFVILASFTVGRLVDVIKLPHITGYLLAGIFVGPSFAHLLGLHVPPFDDGVLNHDVIEQLRPMNTLAIALIALTAGGELKLDGLRDGLRPIIGVLSGQLVAILGLTSLFVWLVGGRFPALALPGIGDLGSAAIPVGLTLGAISFATSPAATIAVINETRAKGRMARTVLSAVVLKDVFVVIFYGVFTAIALQSLGLSSEGSLAEQLAIEIGGSIIVGVGLGMVVRLGLGRLRGGEILIFIVGIVYLATFLAGRFEPHSLDPVLIFLSTGFFVSNFTEKGEALIHTVERLSMPVYVVFFTLTGAELHLEELLGPFLVFALLFVLVRLGAIYIGVTVGGRLAGAAEGTRRYGWMGFASQAGVAITLAGKVGRQFGDHGEALASLIIAGVALNEVFGPVLLKAGLSLAGEIGPRGPAAPVEAAIEEVTVEPEFRVDDRVIDWGPPPAFSSLELRRNLRDLENDLKNVVREVSAGPMVAFRRDAELYLRDLRREFLRHHRRILVQARAKRLDDGVVDQKERTELAALLRAEQAELAERWRTILLSRAAKLSAKTTWTPDAIVETLDNVVDGLPARMRVPYEPYSFESKPNETLWQTLARGALLVRKRLGSKRTLVRSLPLRNLGRYHLAGEVPPRLEAVAALFVNAERHLAGRTRELFDTIVASYDDIAAAALDPEVDLEAQALGIREDVEERLALALEEANRISREGAGRTARVLAAGLRALKSEARVYGTFDLPERARRSSRVFRDRVRALAALTEKLGALRAATGGEFALLAMELELVGLEARVKDLLAHHVDKLEGEVQRRAVKQAQRVEDALAEALQHVESEISGCDRGEEMAAAIRQITAAAEKTIGEAARVSRELRDELLEEAKVAPLLDALNLAAGSLTTRYEVVAGRLQRGEMKLPEPVDRVDVPFREMVAEHIETRVAPQLLRATRDAADRVQPLAAALREAERLVAFNVELATAELDIVLEETVPAETRSLLREILVGQLDRSRSLVNHLALQSTDWPDILGRDLTSAILGALDELRGDLVDGEISRAKLTELRRSASRRRFAQRVDELPSLLRDARRQVGRALTALLGEARILRIRVALGLPVAEREEVSTESFAEPKAIANLPLVYRRLFAADTMEAADVLTGREEQIRRARRALGDQGRDGGKKLRRDLRSVAVVGFDGVGKSAVCNAIVRGGRWKNVKRVALSKPATMDDVDEILRSVQDAQLVVFEGLSWLASSKPGGFAPLRSFVDRVVADSGNRAWLVHAEHLHWKWASAIAPLQDAFPELIRLEPLTIEELTAAVMERHRLSGYGHAFDRLEPRSALEGLVARGASRIRRPFDQYFQDLHSASGGLVRDALRLWLASIRGIASDEIVHVGHVPSSGVLAISQLPDETLLTLFQTARQGWMDAESYAALFRVDESEGHAKLKALKTLGVLGEREGVYRVRRHLRGSVVRVLRKKGWL